MKAKRFLSLMLSLTLAVSLAAPALAQEPPELAPELIQTDVWSLYDEFDLNFAEQYKQDHLEEYAAFDADAWFAQEWSFYDKAEYMELYGLTTEEAFREDMWIEYTTYTAEYDAAYAEHAAQERTRKVEEYRAAHPGELEGLDIRELLAREGYREPMAAYMEDMGLATEEEAVNSLLESYVYGRLAAQERHAQAEAYRQMDPESWEGFDAEAYFAKRWSWYTKEEFMSGWRNLWTEEDFVEYLYLEYMEARNNDYGWWKNEELKLVVNGQTNYDAVLTAENGVSYADGATLNAILGTDLAESEPISIREAAQAAGWDVTWNRWNNEVVLLDRERLLRGVIIDGPILNEEGEQEYVDLLEYDLSQFEELLRRILSAAEVEEGQSYRTTNTYDLELTAFNTLDGDETYSLTLTADILARDNVLDLTVTANAAQLLELLGQNTMNALSRELPKVTFQNLKTLLTGCKAQFILDLEEGEVYWNIPLLAVVDNTVGEDTWYHVSIPDWDLGGVTGLLEDFMAGKAGLGDALYAWLLENSAGSYMGAWDSYSDFFQAYSYLNMFCGEQTMTEERGTLTWALDTDRVNGILGSTMSSYLWRYDEEPMDLKVFKEYNVSLSIDQNGKVTSSVAVRPDMEAIAAMATDSEWYGVTGTALVTWALKLFDFRETAHSQGDANHAQGTAEFHWKNQFKLEVESESHRKAVKDAPRTAPSPGAEIVELY